MNVYRCVLNSVIDMWSILIMMWTHCIGTQDKNKIIYLDKLLRLEIRENINLCFQKVGCDYENAKKVIFTEYGLILVFTAISIFFCLVLFSVIPTMMRIFSHFLIVVLTKAVLDDWGDMSTLQMLIMASSVVYAVVGIYRTIRQLGMMEELGDIIIGGGKRRTSFRFMVSVFVSLTVLGVKLMVLRLMDFRGTGFLSVATYCYFLIAELYIVGYWTRCTYGLFFLRSNVPGFRKVGVLEIVPLFFTSRLAGILKPLNIAGVCILKCLLLFRLVPESSPALRYLENNRMKLYYSIIHMTTYFKSSAMSRECLWRGELKARMNKLHFVEPLLPLMILSCLFFRYIFRDILEFFTAQYVLAIQFAHFFFITELFHTFAVVSILTPYLSESDKRLGPEFDEEKVLSPMEHTVEDVKAK